MRTDPTNYPERYTITGPFRDDKGMFYEVRLVIGETVHATRARCKTRRTAEQRARAERTHDKRWTAPIMFDCGYGEWVMVDM